MENPPRRAELWGHLTDLGGIKYGVSFFLIWAALSWAGPQARILVFLGDSLTAGYGLAEEQAFPALIQEKIHRDGLPWTVVNAGLSGDTTRGGLKRLPWILKSHPSLVFVCLGANDGLRGVPVEEMRRNLEAIVAQVQKSGARVIIAGMQLPTNYGPSHLRRFRDVFPAVAKKHKTGYYPFLLADVAQHPDLNLGDGLHPNEKGHQKIAEQVYLFLKPFLAEPQP